MAEDKKTVPKSVLGQNNYRKRFLRQTTPYKLPKIVRAKGDWFVKYYYEIPDRPGVFKEFRVRDGINYIQDLAEREKEIQELCNDIKHALEKKGHNPFSKDEIVRRQVKELEKVIATPKNWLLKDAIARFKNYIMKQGLAIRTIRTYKNYLSNLENYIKLYPEKNIEASKLTEYDLTEFLDHEMASLSWSTRTYNNYSKFYQTFFVRCEKLERRFRRSLHYDLNFAEIDLKNTKPQRNKAYTSEMIISIKTDLDNEGNEDLRDYIEFIYLSLMRPSEIRSIRIKDIDLEHRQIRIMGKTGDRLIPISDQLHRLIIKRLTVDHNFNYFLFGMAGKVSVNRMSVDFFADKYRTIKDKYHLDENYTLYAWKHTGVIRMIKAGFKDEEIRILSGHKTQAAFEAYKRDLVIDNSHVMKGSTIEF